MCPETRPLSVQDLEYTFSSLWAKNPIFIARLPKGLIGDTTAKFLGALLKTHFQQAALQRADIPEHQRIPFSLIADEFQSFLTDEPEAFATTLAEARNNKIILTLAHQFLAQIHDDELSSAVQSNAGNLLVFRVSGHDATFLEDTFSPTVGRQLFVNLPRGDVIARLVHDGTPSVPFIGTITPALENQHNAQGKIIIWSRRLFTQPQHRVEVLIAQHIAQQEPMETPAKHRRARR